MFIGFVSIKQRLFDYFSSVITSILIIVDIIKRRMTSKKKVSNETENLRLRYDTQLAHAMRGGNTNNSIPCDINVNNAFSNLDRAEQLSQNNNKLEEAMTLYRQSIEELMKVLTITKGQNNTSSGSINGGFSRDVIMARTHAALSEAESLKERIEKKNQSQSTRNLQLSNASQKSVKSIRSLNTNSKEGSSSSPKKRSNLDYNSDDPMIKTIKNDMYVDSSSISTTWEDISGLPDAKRALQEAAILPLLRPDLYTGLRSPPKGILLYGPPGTGKTMLVRAVAHESKCILFACSASAMTSKWVGEGEKLVRTLFRMASDVAPSIIFLDEMDALLGSRKSDGNEQESSRRFKTEFMVQMEGINAGNGNGGGVDHRTLVIGCTNCPWDIDDAVMRRFQRRIYVPLPDREARMALWNHLIKKAGASNNSKNVNASSSPKTVAISPREVKTIVDATDGFSCSDISSIANEAAFGPLRELGGIEAIRNIDTADVRPIQMKDFMEAIKNSKKSVSQNLLNRYDAWEKAQSSVSK